VYLEHAEATRALALFDDALQLFSHRAHLGGQVFCGGRCSESPGLSPLSSSFALCCPSL
jgi:hypothetical protein